MPSFPTTPRHSQYLYTPSIFFFCSKRRMAFFDGSGARKRTINLGGRGATRTSRSNVQQAQLARQQREEQRRRIAAATTIQAAVRQWRFYKHKVDHWCSSINNDIESWLTRSPSESRSSTVPHLLAVFTFLNRTRHLLFSSLLKQNLTRWTEFLTTPEVHQSVIASITESPISSSTVSLVALVLTQLLTQRPFNPAALRFIASTCLASVKCPLGCRAPHVLPTRSVASLLDFGILAAAHNLSLEPSLAPPVRLVLLSLIKQLVASRETWALKHLVLDLLNHSNPPKSDALKFLLDFSKPETSLVPQLIQMDLGLDEVNAVKLLCTLSALLSPDVDAGNKHATILYIQASAILFERHLRAVRYCVERGAQGKHNHTQTSSSISGSLAALDTSADPDSDSDGDSSESDSDAAAIEGDGESIALDQASDAATDVDGQRHVLGPETKMALQAQVGVETANLVAKHMSLFSLPTTVSMLSRICRLDSSYAMSQRIATIYAALIDMASHSLHSSISSERKFRLLNAVAFDAVLQHHWLLRIFESRSLLTEAIDEPTTASLFRSNTISTLILSCQTLKHRLMFVDDDEFLCEVEVLCGSVAEFQSFIAQLTDLAVVLFTRPIEVLRACDNPSSVTVLRSSITVLLKQLHLRTDRLPDGVFPPTFWHSAQAFGMARERILDSITAHSFPSGNAADEPPQALGRFARRRHRHQPHRLHHIHTQDSDKVLSLLHNIPFVLPFMDRVSVFKQLVETRAVRSQRLKADASRGQEYQSAFDNLSMVGQALVNPVSVVYRDASGQAEAGIDGGGLRREFFYNATLQGFGEERHLFVRATDGGVYPNPDVAFIEEHHKRHMHFLGNLIGKLLHDGMLIDIPFSHFFLTKVLGQRASLSELSFYDDSLHANLLGLKKYTSFGSTQRSRPPTKQSKHADNDSTVSGTQRAQAQHAGKAAGTGGEADDDEAEERRQHQQKVEEAESMIQMLELTFVIQTSELAGGREVELIPNGRDIAVTKDNVLQYIYLVADYRLNRQIAASTKQFCAGLFEIIPQPWLEMFSPSELQKLVSGETTMIDVDDMQEHARYSYGYDRDDITIQLFWSVVGELDNNDLKLLLQFVTSCPRPPIQGFRVMQPPLTIAPNSDDESRLPTASTCSNLLKLPRYKSKQQLREKLLYSIRSNSGFALS
eukprot:m.360661 g.360661  ORF g.360661 m.360661 type:complete len:1173 (-) comp19143_c0_seq1:276-3794(-)